VYRVTGVVQGFRCSIRVVQGYTCTEEYKVYTSSKVVRVYRSSKVLVRGLGVIERYSGTMATRVLQWCLGTCVVKYRGTAAA